MDGGTREKEGAEQRGGGVLQTKSLSHKGRWDDHQDQLCLLHNGLLVGGGNQLLRALEPFQVHCVLVLCVDGFHHLLVA